MEKRKWVGRDWPTKVKKTKKKEEDEEDERKQTTVLGRQGSILLPQTAVNVQGSY